LNWVDGSRADRGLPLLLNLPFLSASDIMVDAVAKYSFTI
jgi:hypothetical protein